MEHHRSTTGLLALASAAMLLLLFSHPLVHGDGTAHLMYLDSIAGDGDLDLANQAQRFAAASTYHLFPSPATGELVTAFPFGSAFLLAPWYWLAQVLEPRAPALRASPDYFFMRQGLPLAYSFTAMLGAMAYTLAAVWLSYATALRVAPARASGLAAVGCLAGTPLLYYATIEPLSTHAYGAVLLAGVLYLASCSPATPMPPRRALLIGLLLGMATLVRWQLLLYAVPASMALLVAALRGPRDQTRWAAVLAMGSGVALFVAVCAWYFARYFGAPFLIPSSAQSGQGFVGQPLRFLPQVLLDSADGWLPLSPLVAFGLAGMAGMAWLERGRQRALALVCLAGIGLQLALNSSLHDWFGGWAFGQRRMTEAYAALVVGLAWLLGRAGRARGPTTVLVVAGALYGIAVLAAHLYYTHASPHPDGGDVATMLRWLFDPARWAHLRLLWADRWGPWAWAHPEL